MSCFTCSLGSISRSKCFFPRLRWNRGIYPHLRWSFTRFSYHVNASLSRIHVHAYVGTHIPFFVSAGTIKFRVCRCWHSSLSEMWGKHMLEQQRWQAHPSDTNMRTDVSSTYVKPLHAGSSKYTSPYPYSAGTAIPPPPPDLYPPLPSQRKTIRGYLIALAILTLIVIVLGSLEEAIEFVKP